MPSLAAIHSSVQTQALPSVNPRCLVCRAPTWADSPMGSYCMPCSAFGTPRGGRGTWAMLQKLYPCPCDDCFAIPNECERIPSLLPFYLHRQNYVYRSAQAGHCTLSGAEIASWHQEVAACVLELRESPMWGER